MQTKCKSFEEKFHRVEFRVTRNSTRNSTRRFRSLCHYDLRKFSFTNRTVNIWNSLSNTVVEVDTVDKFKLRLDKFWMYQDIKYDFTAELTGTGDRSEYDIENYY